MKFDTQFEETILAAALCDVSYLKKAAGVLNAHHFSTPQHGWLWKEIKRIWEEHRETATQKLIMRRVARAFSDLEKREPYKALVRRIFKIKPKTADSSLDELSLFVRSVNMQLALEESADALAKGRVDDAYKTISQLNRNDLVPRVYTTVKWIEDFETRQAERAYKKLHPEKFKRIPTGFKRLDAITGGLEVGELGLILATTNQGKSIMLTNLAHHAIKLGYKVAYFTFEMSSIKIATRQDSRWLGLLYNKFKFYDFEKGELKIIDRRLRKMKKRWTGRLRIIGMPVRRCDTNTVRTALDDLYQDEEFSPDMLLMDSGDHMISVDQFESFRLQQSAVYWDMKSLAEEDGYAIWTSTHAPRDFAHELATAEATGESYDKARIADMVVSLNTPSKKSRRTTIRLDMDDENGDDDDQSDVSMMAKGKYLEMYLAKYRDGDSRISMPLDAQFARMLIKELEVEERTGDGKSV